MMKPLLEYLDYRQYIEDFFAYKKRISAFTWRDFAKNAGFSSAVFLNYVCSGKKNLSPKMAKQVANAMNLFGFEEAYFVYLVEYAHAKSKTEKSAIYQKILELSKTHEVRAIGGAELEYFSSWTYQAIRELASAMPHATPGQIGEKLRPKVKASEVSKVLKFLVKNDLLREVSKGIYKQTNRSVRLDASGVESSEKADILKEISKNLQKQMSDLAIDSTGFPREERFIGGITIGVSKKMIPCIMNEVREFRNRIKALATQFKEADQVYRLNLHLFPLSEAFENLTHQKNFHKAELCKRRKKAKRTYSKKLQNLNSFKQEFNKGESNGL